MPAAAKGIPRKIDRAVLRDRRQFGDLGMAGWLRKLREMGRKCKLFHVEHIVITDWLHIDVMTLEISERQTAAFIWRGLGFNGKDLLPISSEICTFTATSGCSYC
jgi:hypothetical protein